MYKNPVGIADLHAARMAVTDGSCARGLPNEMGTSLGEGASSERLERSGQRATRRQPADRFIDSGELRSSLMLSPERPEIRPSPTLARA
jgi:hypothetical protein